MREQEPKSQKEILFDEVLKVLEENGALCMDVEEERKKLAVDLSETLWNRDRKLTTPEDEDYKI